MERFKNLTKEIAVQCKTESEAKILLEYLAKLGFMWASGDKLFEKFEFEAYEDGCVYHINLDDEIAYSDLSYAKDYCNVDIIKFSDLILPVSPKELLLLKEEMCSSFIDDYTDNCPICKESGHGCHYCSQYVINNIDKATEILLEYKASKEKSEEARIETEMVNMICIYDKDSNQLVYRQETDKQPDEATEIFKEYIKNHEGSFYMMYNNVCKVKGETL